MCFKGNLKKKKNTSSILSIGLFIPVGPRSNTKNLCREQLPQEAFDSMSIFSEIKTTFFHFYLFIISMISSTKTVTTSPSWASASGFNCSSTSATMRMSCEPDVTASTRTWLWSSCPASGRVCCTAEPLSMCCKSWQHHISRTTGTCKLWRQREMTSGRSISFVSLTRLVCFT